MILILTQLCDPHADRVEAGLRARGADVFRLDHAEFPGHVTVEASIGNNGPRTVLHSSQGTLDLEQVTAVWHRRPQPPAPAADHLDENAQAYVAEECRTFLDGLWQSLDCFKMPGEKFLFRAAESKLCQLRLAAQLGVDIPPTLITNSPQKLREFYREQGGCIISKLASGAFHRSEVAHSSFRYTELVSPRDLTHSRSIRHAPMIFQGYVPKKVELRVTVVGNQVFAAEIHSQSTNHTRHDWRRYDHGNTPIAPHDLPQRYRDFCVSYVRRLGLHYGAIDMILTPDGRYVFIEINPNGQYLWIENESGLPITEAVCDLLWNESRSRSLAA
jgi:hypothetical protein